MGMIENYYLCFFVELMNDCGIYGVSCIGIVNDSVGVGWYDFVK